MGGRSFVLYRVEDIVEKGTAKEPEASGHCKEDHVHDEHCGHGTCHWLRVCAVRALLHRIPNVSLTCVVVGRP